MKNKKFKIKIRKKISQQQSRQNWIVFLKYFNLFFLNFFAKDGFSK